jgi:hypothetical protein
MFQNVNETGGGTPPSCSPRDHGRTVATSRACSVSAEALGAVASKAPVKTPVIISMHEQDNVAIVANDGGLSAGTVLPSGLVLRDHVPQGTRWRWRIC